MMNLTFKNNLTVEAKELLTGVLATNTKEAKELKVKLASKILVGLSEGNIKLTSSDKIKFLIWSIPADYSNLMQMRICSNSTISCKKLCYAKKAERLYPSVRNRRNLNLIASLSNEFIKLMIEEIESKINSKKYQDKTIFVRIHEAGDFYNMEYLTSWIYITNHFKDNKNIKFMAYTKELTLLKEAFKIYGKDNININFKSSIWNDTKEENLQLTKELDLSIFTALKKEEIKEAKFIVCPASHNNITCDLCKLCYTSQKNIAIEIH